MPQLSAADGTGRKKCRGKTRGTARGFRARAFRARAFTAPAVLAKAARKVIIPERWEGVVFTDAQGHYTLEELLLSK